MIASLPRSAWLRTATVLYVAAFLIFLFLPLVTVAVFAFNNAPYPAPPWRGFTFDWFVGNQSSGRVGLFHDSELLGSIWTSVVVASWVTALSLAVGTANAFLMERFRFPGRQALSVLMLTPLVIPGVILGISILSLMSRIAEFADAEFALDLDFLRPGLPLVVLGQFSYIATIATLMISARLKRFDRTLEEAALNLGASHAAVLRTITFPYLFTISVTPSMTELASPLLYLTSTIAIFLNPCTFLMSCLVVAIFFNASSVAFSLGPSAKINSADSLASPFLAKAWSVLRV